MDKPKTELAFRVPASKITKKNMYEEDETIVEGLDTSIDWKNTGDNSYDGEKLKFNMSGYDSFNASNSLSKMGSCTVHNQKVLNVFAYLGLYDYTDFFIFRLLQRR